jgi:hypothetical protein
MPDQKAPDVSTPSAAYNAQAAKRKLVRLLLEGVEAVRTSCGEGNDQAGILRRERGETTPEFTRRRDQSELVNFLAEMVKDHAGRLFRRPPAFGPDVPVEIRGSQPAAASVQSTEAAGALLEDIARELAPEGGLTRRFLEALRKRVQEWSRGARRMLTNAEPEVQGWAENIDISGSRGGKHLWVFARELYEDAKADGNAFVLVDMPPAPSWEKTQEDRKRSGRRPYWVKMVANDCIEATPRMVNGAPRLAQFRKVECGMVKTSRWDPGTPVKRWRVFLDGLEDFEATAEQPGIPWDHPGFEDLAGEERARTVLPPGHELRFARWELWEDRTVKAEGGAEVKLPVLVGQGAMKPWRSLPIVECNLGEGGFFEATPPRETIAVAETTRKHFREMSAVDSFIRTANLAVVHRSGHNPPDGEDQNRLSENRFFSDPDPMAKMVFVEPEGKSLAQSRENLKETEARARRQMMEPLMAGSGDRTATEAGIVTAKANSRLESDLLKLVDALELLMDYTMQWVGKPAGSGGSLIPNLEGLAQVDPVGFDRVLKLAEQGKVDDITLLTEAKRYTVLGEDQDPEAILEKVKQQGPLGMIGEDSGEEIASLKDRLAKLEAGAANDPRQAAA